MVRFQSEPAIFEDATALETNYRDDLFVESEQKATKLVNQFETVLHGEPPKNIYLTGEPGTGKTSTTRHSLDLLADEMDSKNRTLNTVLTTVSIDSTAYQTLVQIVNELRQKREAARVSQTGHSYQDVLYLLHDELDRLDGVLYFVIDEADSLRDPNKLFKDLSRLNEHDALSDVEVGIVAIGNQMNWVDELSSSALSSFQTDPVLFSTYSPEEIEEILESRAEVAFKQGIISEEKISFAAAKCLRSGGDIRDALKLLRKAGEIARIRNKGSSEESNKPQVTIKDIEEASKELSPAQVEKTIQNLSEQKLEILVVLTMYEFEEDKENTTSRLHQLISAEFGDLDISERYLRSLLESLVEQGLLCREKTNNGRGSGKQGRYHHYRRGTEILPILQGLSKSDYNDETGQADIETLCDLAEDAGLLSSERAVSILN